MLSGRPGGWRRCVLPTEARSLLWLRPVQEKALSPHYTALPTSPDTSLHLGPSFALITAHWHFISGWLLPRHYRRCPPQHAALLSASLTYIPLLEMNGLVFGCIKHVLLTRKGYYMNCSRALCAMDSSFPLYTSAFLSPANFASNSFMLPSR